MAAASNQETLTVKTEANMKLNTSNWKWIVAGILAVQCTGRVLADDSGAEISLLKQQLQELDQKIRVLERDREIDQDAAADAAKAAPKISLGQDGFSFASSDSNFVAQLHAVIQWDSRTFFSDRGINGNSGFLLRRARPIFSGTVFHDFDYNFTPDFAGSFVQVQDAYLNYHYRPELQVQAGKFKAPVGLEQLEWDANALFNERSLVTDLVPNRDLGVELHGDLLDGRVSYAAGVFNGAPDYASATTNQSYQSYESFDGRLFFQPWKTSGVDALRGLGFGVGGNYQADHPNTNYANGLTPGYATDGQQKFFTYNSGVYADGPLWRISPQAYYYYGPLGLMGEYVIDDQNVAGNGIKPKDLSNRAWEITGSWVLTGDDASYNGVTPLHPFDPRINQWGAWQVLARYSELSVDHDVFADGLANSTKSASGARAWSVGLNWYLNRNVRADVSYSHTVFSGYTGGVPSTPTAAAQPESVVFTRLQLAF